MIDHKQIFTGDNKQDETKLDALPEPPPWRNFEGNTNIKNKGKQYLTNKHEIDMVNAALILRRPLLITGPPGTGKSSLAYAIAHELNIGPVHLWPIVSKTTLQDGLYSYDAIGRLNDSSQKENTTQNKNAANVGNYIKLGPLGAAFALSKFKKPSIVLIDEIDKSDIDLPNDLLHIFEDGEFEITELARDNSDTDNLTSQVYIKGQQDKIEIPANGLLRCQEFPLVILTSNDEREFPPAFLRRCLRLHQEIPDNNKMLEIIEAHIPSSTGDQSVVNLLNKFVSIRDDEGKALATDQLLNAIQLVINGHQISENEALMNSIFEALED